MKSPFVFRPWARAWLLLFVFITLPKPNAQCGSPLGRVFGAVKDRVDRALHKIGVGRDREPVPPGDQQDGRTPEPGDPTAAPPPVVRHQSTPPPASRESSSKPADPSGKRSKKSDSSIAVKSPSRTASQPKPAEGAATVTLTGERPEHSGAGETPMIKPGSGSPKAATTGPKAEPIAPVAKISFAKPVPGKRGFVYPPGAEEDMKNILDVRGFTPGQKMRDPRTGNVFLVP